MANDQVIVDEQCKKCGGTGIYHGFAEPEGVGVLCFECESTGKVELKYIPFTGRKERSDIHTVRISRGSLLAFGVDPRGGGVTYQEFLEGKMPSDS